MKAQRPWVVIVGDFLGAGKTTLILTATKLLTQRGPRSAVVLNDQGNELVDTTYVKVNGLPAGEVTGGCFCCRFSMLVSVMEDLRSYEPEQYGFLLAVQSIQLHLGVGNAGNLQHTGVGDRYSFYIDGGHEHCAILAPKTRNFGIC